MIPIKRCCDVENIADFSRYYSASWVGQHLPDQDYIRPCYIGGMVTETLIQLRPLHFEDNQFFLNNTPLMMSWKDLQNQIDFGVPDIGISKDGPTIVFCSYTTPRAAKKGYRPREVQVSRFNSWNIRKKHSTNASRDKYDWVWAAFNPEYSTLQHAEDRLNKGEVIGVPLSRTLGIYSKPDFKNSLVAYKRWTIGHVVSPELIHIKREYEDYEGEVSRQTSVEVIVG